MVQHHKQPVVVQTPECSADQGVHVDSYRIHTDTYRYIQIKLFYLVFIMGLSCMYLVFICIYPGCILTYKDVS